MRHTGRSEYIPVSPINGCLIPHHQRSDQPCGIIGHSLKNLVANLTPRPFHRMLPALPKGVRYRVFGTSPNVTIGLYTLFPLPQFLVKTMRIDAAVRSFQA